VNLLPELSGECYLAPRYRKQIDIKVELPQQPVLPLDARIEREVQKTLALKRCSVETGSVPCRS